MTNRAAFQRVRPAVQKEKTKTFDRPVLSKSVVSNQFNRTLQRHINEFAAVLMSESTIKTRLFRFFSVSILMTGVPEIINTDDVWCNHTPEEVLSILLNR